MSLASWKREFYKTPANKVSKKFALQHSLRKWTGLLRKNRRKHKVRLVSGRLHDSKDRDKFIYIDDDSCALCQYFLDVSLVNLHSCFECPLVKTGLISCVDDDSAYELFVNEGRVVSMVRALGKALKIQQKGK